jgi:hypothetical protein
MIYPSLGGEADDMGMGGMGGGMPGMGMGGPPGGGMDFVSAVVARCESES